MGWLNNWLSGCHHTPNLIVAIIWMLAHFLNSLFAAVMGVILAILKVTVLSSAGDNTVMNDIHTTMGYLDVVAFAMLSAFLIWAVLTNGERLITTGQWDGWQGLVGRAGSAVLWIAGSFLAVQLLMRLNNSIVQSIVYSMAAQTKEFAFSCPASVHTSTAVMLGLTLTGIDTGILPLLFQGFLIALVLGLIFVIIQWLGRLAEILFWGSLLPVAASTLVIDGSRQIFNFVWRNIQGAILTQSAMALGLWMVFHLILSDHGVNPGTSLLNLLLGIACIFLVAKIPAYFQQMLGHSTSGGFDMAKGAGAILMARGAGALLQATPMGQFADRMVESMAATSDWKLNSQQNLVSGLYHRMGVNVARGQAVNEFQGARYAAAGGAFALENAGKNVKQRFEDAYKADQSQRFGKGGGSGGGGTSGDPGTPPPEGMGGSPYWNAASNWMAFDDGGAAPDLSAGNTVAGAAEDGFVPSADTALGMNAVPTPSSDAGQAGSPAGQAMDKQKFVDQHADALKQYLQDYVMPMTVARYAFDPRTQLQKLNELQGYAQSLNGHDAATFAKLTGVRVEDLERADVQDRIKKDLQAKAWGGNLHYHQTDPSSMQGAPAYGNAAVRSITVGTSKFLRPPERDLALNFGGPPSQVAQRVHAIGFTLYDAKQAAQQTVHDLLHPQAKS